MMTPQELERLVMLASDMTVPQQQKWEATSVLSKWTAEEDPRSVASTLLQTLPASQDEQVLFYALTTFQREHLLRSCAIDQRRELRRFLLSGTLSSASTFLRTKAGVVLACLIRVDFPETWPDAFDELRRQASPDLFFRSLDALLEDLDQNPDFDTSRKIRDVMRSLPNAGQNSGTALAPSIAPSQSVSAELLLQLIVYLEQSLSQQAEEIASLALRVLKRFVSWIDMSLVLDDRVMRLVFACLRSSNGDIGVPAVGCLQELIGRGMDEDKKVALLVDADLLAKVHANVDLQTVDASPIEVVIEVAKLIDSTGLQLLPMVERSTNGASSLSRLWSQLTDLFFRCFAYDDIDVSGAVIPLASALAVAMGKEGGSTESGLSAHLPRLMSILYRQSRYPTGFQFDPEDDDEAEEEMYRDDLRKLYQRLIRVSPQLCLQFLCEALSNLPVPISTSATSDVEASLRLVYHYCEGIRPPPGLKIVMKDETFRAVLVALHGSDIVSHSHREVLILYYDVAVRYYPIFLDQPELLQKVLQGMSASSGLQHSHPRVRSRSAYLLLRLVKSVIKVMQPYVETAVNGIQGM
jgi:exportin-T